MMWIKMSCMESHGREVADFAFYLWAPTHKRNTSQPNLFWHNILSVKPGDKVFHLRRNGSKSYFVGYSTVSAEPETTNEGPALPTKWDYADSYYRAPLTDYVPFKEPVLLQQQFKEKDQPLKAFYTSLDRSPKNIFFVMRDDGKLACMQGGYLSILDEGLYNVLLKEFCE